MGLSTQELEEFPMGHKPADLKRAERHKGFGLLVSSLMYKGEWERKQSPTYFLQGYPFGLPTSWITASEVDSIYRTDFVGLDNDPARDVYMMMQKIMLMVSCHTDLPEHLRLRIIYGDVDPSYPHHHRLYYEVALAKYSLLCGAGCNYIDEGKKAIERMEAVFALLSHAYSVNIERQSMKRQDFFARREELLKELEIAARRKINTTHHNS